MFDTLETYLTLSVTDCKRLGFFRPDAVASGVVRWNRQGKQVAAVGFATDTRGVPVAKLSYTYKGTPVDYDIFLRWKHSNLNPNGEHGYYYFVCPVTGRLCRKLYLDNGRFVSRFALNVPYEKQNQSHTRRRGLFAYLETAQAAEELTNQKYRRETYRGKPTPYARKLERLAQKLEKNAPYIKMI